MNKLTKEYEFAVRNGYKGTHEEYVRLNYAGYVASMKRMDVPVAGFEKWLENQK
jgi:hypothetical protein